MRFHSKPESPVPPTISLLSIHACENHSVTTIHVYLTVCSEHSYQENPVRNEKTISFR